VIGDLGTDSEIECREIEIERTGGERISLSVTARTCDGAGPWLGARVLFVRDDSDRVLERKALERKNAELESYVHSVSHDLRSPLVSLVGFTRLLRQDYDEVLGETGRHFADRIEQAARTMETLIDDLLELSRIGVGNEVRSLVDPRAVLLQLRAELKLRLDANASTLCIPEDPPLLLCDRTRLYQLFSNLVGNALQHMGDCSDRNIEVEVATRADHHLITVTDHGHGIPESEHERVFEVFHSTDRSGGDGRSTGVGLAIVRKIAETHGGRVWVESTPGNGARFAVSLPRR
jgi:signal transduction histidine kinase